MKDFFSKIQTLTLSDTEREEMRARLNAYQSFKPLKTAERNVSHHRLPEVKPLMGFLSIFNTKPMNIIATLVIAALVGGGTTYAAEASVPGDTLYGLKTGLTENVRGALALNTEARAEFESWRAERRLAEAEKLSARGSFSEERRADLETRFMAHAERMEAHVELLAERNPARASELSARLETSLAARQAALVRKEESATQRIGVAAQVAVDRLVDVRARINTRIIAEADETGASVRADAATRMRTNAARALERAQTLFTEVEATLSNESRARIEAEIQSNTQVFADAERSLNAEVYGEAFVRFQSVLIAMDRVGAFIRTQSGAEASARVREERTPSNSLDTHIDTRGEQSSGAEVESQTNVRVDGNTDETRVEVDTSGRLRLGI